MEKGTIIVLIIGVFASCKSSGSMQDLQGQYYKQSNDYLYNLVLNKDSSFILTQKYFEVNSKCEGKWMLLSKDTLLLKCNPENLSAQLQSSYMNEREKRVIVLGRNKLQIGNTVLRRQ